MSSKSSKSLCIACTCRWASLINLVVSASSFWCSNISRVVFTGASGFRNSWASSEIKLLLTILSRSILRNATCSCAKVCARSFTAAEKTYKIGTTKSKKSCVVKSCALRIMSGIGATKWPKIPIKVLTATESTTSRVGNLRDIQKRTMKKMVKNKNSKLDSIGVQNKK